MQTRGSGDTLSSTPERSGVLAGGRDSFAVQVLVLHVHSDLHATTPERDGSLEFATGGVRVLPRDLAEGDEPIRGAQISSARSLKTAAIFAPPPAPWGSAPLGGGL